MVVREHVFDDAIETKADTISSPARLQRRKKKRQEPIYVRRVISSPTYEKHAAGALTSCNCQQQQQQQQQKNTNTNKRTHKRPRRQHNRCLTHLLAYRLLSF